MKGLVQHFSLLGCNNTEESTVISNSSDQNKQPELIVTPEPVQLFKQLKNL